MIEDKLSHEERLRLECLAQAVAFSVHKMSKTAEQVVESAKRFETYVLGQRVERGRRAAGD